MPSRTPTKKKQKSRAKQSRGKRTTFSKVPSKTLGRKPAKKSAKATAGKSSRPAKRRKQVARRVSTEPGERLQKILAAAGFGSRRACEELILAGRVEVNGKVVAELGARADTQQQEIRVDGEVLRRQRLVYYAAYKPKGVISTSSDPSGRARVTDLVPDKTRVFTVGRLDRESEGLVLLTNDGELANRLTHPRHGVEKIYQVQVAGKAEWEVIKQLKRGVYLAEGRAKVKHLKILKQHKQSTLLEMILDEGKNREIRRVLAHLGHKVQNLKRVAIGTLRLGTMIAGEYRPLTKDEIRRLQELAAGKGRHARKTTTEKGQEGESASARTERATGNKSDAQRSSSRNTKGTNTSRSRRAPLASPRSNDSSKRKPKTKTARKASAKLSGRKKSSRTGKPRKPSS